MRPAEQLCVARLIPFSHTTYVLQVMSLGFLTYTVPAVLAHGFDGAADGIVVVGVVDDVAVVVDVIPVVSAVPEYTDEASCILLVILYFN